MSIYLITGSTGFLGSKLIREMISCLPDSKFIVFARGNYEDRVNKDFFDIKDVILDYVNFDLSNYENVDLNYIFEKYIHIDGVIHIAANLSFKSRDKEIVFKSNIDATKMLLSISTKYTCPFYYISTVYVHGKSTGEIKEEFFDEKPNFHNFYEESKYLAEILVRDTALKNNFKYIIFRPSILVDNHAGTVAELGFYTVAKTLYQFIATISKIHLLRQFYIKKSKLPFKLLTSNNAILDIFEVSDAVTLMVSRIINLNESKIFNICNPNPPSMNQALFATLESYGIKDSVKSKSFSLVKRFYSIILSVLRNFSPTARLSKRLSYFIHYMYEEHIHIISYSDQEIIKLKTPSNIKKIHTWVMELSKLAIK